MKKKRGLETDLRCLVQQIRNIYITGLVLCRCLHALYVGEE